MITSDIYYDFFSGYIITGCCVREKNIIYFMVMEDIEAQGKDPFVTLPDTRVIMHYPDEPELKEQWAYDGFPGTKRMKAGVCFTPEERFVGVDAWGQVFVIGGGSSSFENPIGINERVTITNIKCIANSKAYAVGTRRTIYRRDGINHWAQITQTDDLPLPEHISMYDTGFDDIDGFSDTDIYTCGYGGEIMHFDGQRWHLKTTPVNTSLNEICCAEDGYVYIAGNHGVILKGRDEQWQEIAQDLTEDSFDNIVWFKDRIYIATWLALYQLVDDQLVPVDPGPGVPPFYCGQGLSARDGILVTAGQSSALQFDGENWTVLVGLESDAELQDTANALETINTALDNALDAMNDLDNAIKQSKE